MEKWKSKIKKLLALAESDNIHEAERAKVQAEKLMARYRITRDNMDIETIPAKSTVPRKYYRKSEIQLAQTIAGISGCYVLTTSTQGRSGRYATTVQYMGLGPDAEMAAYTWDVLHRQLVDKMRSVKQEYKLKADHLEQYAQGWVAATDYKISMLFGRKTPSGQVTKELASRGLKTVRARKTKSLQNEDLEQGLIGMGAKAGLQAELNHGATDQYSPSRALPCAD